MNDIGIKKRKKHYTIFINGQPLKIINHFVSDRNNSTIRIITKIRGQQFPGGLANIEIPADDFLLSISGTLKSQVASLTTEVYVYEILVQKQIRRV